MEPLTLDVEAAVEKSPARFDAILHPHSSLGPSGFMLVMAMIGVTSFIAGVAFVIAGAWPVFGFLGFDVVLVYVAFKLNYRDARRYETVTLTDDELTVRKVEPNGRRRTFKFQPYWLQVDLDDPPGPGSELMLRTHGMALEIGKFLTADEKAEFACALRAELLGLRDQSRGQD